MQTESHHHLTLAEIDPRLSDIVAAKKVGAYIVSVFLCDRAYGGPEEGGWYYDCGELVRTIRVFKNEESAYAFCRRLNDKLAATLNAGRRPVSSVLSDGRFSARVDEDLVERHFHATRPFYE